MTPATYAVLDAVADSFDPLLTVGAVAAPFLRKPRTLRSTMAYYLSTAAAIAFVYLVRVINLHLHIWASAGIRYSTHSAFAASLVASMGAFNRRWFAPLALATLLYFLLELVMRYHGVLDIVSSALLAALAALLLQLAAARDQSRREPPRPGA